MNERIESDVQGTPILATKLQPPQRREVIVRRERLERAIKAKVRPALTLVSAPAGFGKTTLLAECARADDRATSWLSLDAADNDPTRFWLHVLAALRVVEPAIGNSSQLFLASGSAGEDVAVALLNELAGLGHDVVIVLDDYHVIESLQVHESVEFMLEHLPGNVRLMLGSRVDPPLPLARLRASGNLAEVRAADLRFTPSESAAYLNGPMRLSLTEADIDRLDARTEGWIAAIQLAALSLQGRSDVSGFIEAFAGDDRFVVDYLAEEVLDRQPEAVRDFLLRTSILERLSGSLCDAVTATSGGKNMLQSLDRSNLFLVPLDDQRRWYRYHHLFADVLQACLLDEQPGFVAELHRRASDWYEAHGQPADAVEHALRGHDSERAARLIELAFSSLRRARQEVTLRRWLEALPAEALVDRPVLSMALVAARMSTGDTAGVAELVERVEHQLKPRGRDQLIVFDHDEFARLPAQTAVYRAGLALLAGNPGATIAHARRARTLTEASDQLGHGSAAALIGLAHWACGELDQAEDHYADSIEHLRAAGHISDVLGCCLAIADIQIARGRSGDARSTHESALRLADHHGVTRGTADMHVGLAALLIGRNDLQAAAHQLEIATGLGDHAGLPQNAYRSRVAAAQLFVARGNLDEAAGLLDEAAAFYNTDFSPPTHPVAARAARINLLRGDLDAARRWARDAHVTVDDSLSYVREFEHATLARVLLATYGVDRNDTLLRDAMALLERLLDTAQAGNWTGSILEILLLRAAAHHAAGAQTVASDSLERALALAAAEGHVRVFLDITPSLEPLLRDTSLAGEAGRHLERVLAALSGTVVRGQSGPASSRMVDDLTGRERDVLRLLRTELSGPEIARELHVSLNTLRTHTKSIFTKLGATNRREAVRIAAEDGH